MDSNNNASGFIPPVDIGVSSEFTDFTELTTEGFNRLVRAKRYGRWWMLKGLKDEFRGQTAYELMLKKEFDMMSQLSHRGIAMVNSIERVDGIGLAIVMEWIDGTTLSAWLQHRPKRSERLDIAFQLIDALAYIHGKQIVHRDLKPQNIMIATNGNALKIIDFGLSDSDSYALMKQPAGSIGYLSPEQRAGGKPDIRNDIYSLGCILCNLRLGFFADFVVRRCRMPIEKRYKNAEEVGAALRRTRLMPYLYAALFALILIVAALCLWPHGKTAEAESQSATEAKTESLRPTPIPLPAVKIIQSNAKTEATGNSDREKTADSERQVIDNAIKSGQQKIDREMLAYDKEIRAAVDTLSFVCYIEPRLNAIIHEMASEISRYASSFDAQLSNAYSSTEIENTLLLYVKDSYYQAWIKLIESRQLPQRPI